MNCKPNDLAVIVHSLAGNEGKIVRCVRLATDSELADVNFNDVEGPVWVIDRKLPATIGAAVPFVIDSRLRPIRPNDGEDETLTWAGKPAELTELESVR